MKRLYSIIHILLILLLSGCNENLDQRTTITFVGDSIIARWDLQAYFSSFATINMGQSGSGINYLESLTGTMKSKNVAIISGTNDSYMMTPSTLQEYTERYISAILNLGANKVYLYSVLPRNFVGDSADTNYNILSFNERMAAEVQKYPQIIYIWVYSDFINEDGSIVYEFYSDGLHLNQFGYEKLASKLINLV